MTLETKNTLSAPQLLHETARGWWFSKPPGWLSVYPTISTEDPILAAWVQSQSGKNVFPVHRLDRETSGVILIAKDREYHREASQWFERRNVMKIYHFLARTEDLKAGSPPVWRCQDPVAGRQSETQFQVIQKKTHCFLGEARPKTGRRHQIRIHLSNHKLSILGDSSYGGATQILNLQSTQIPVNRVMLHSFRLRTPDGNDVIAPYFPDFETIWSGQ